MKTSDELLVTAGSIILLLCLPLLYIRLSRIPFHWKAFFKGMFLYFLLRFGLINPLVNLCLVYFKNDVLVLLLNILLSVFIFLFAVHRFSSRNDFHSLLAGASSALLYVDVIRILIENFTLIQTLRASAGQLASSDYCALLLSSAIPIFTINYRARPGFHYGILLVLSHLCLRAPGQLWIPAITLGIGLLPLRMTRSDHG